MNIISTHNPGLVGGNVTKPRVFRPRNRIFRPSPIPPLSLEKKLAAVNALQTPGTKRSVTSMPPPQIVLTPAQPIQGASSMSLMGWWVPSCGAVSLSNQSGWTNCYVLFDFVGLASGTYLLDVSMSGGVNWQFSWCIGTGSSLQEATLVYQDGHLLYPFIGSGEYVFFLWPPSGGVFNWIKTELTKVA